MTVEECWERLRPFITHEDGGYSAIYSGREGRFVDSADLAARDLVLAVHQETVNYAHDGLLYILRARLEALGQPADLVEGK